MTALTLHAEPLGTVPPPATLGGVVKTAAKGLLGRNPTLFIDKLGERLAFERSGVRLYEALITKFDSQGGFDGGPERSHLEQMMMEEYEHFRLLTEAVTKVGADPTVITPSADVHATIAHGPLAVIVDPRTSFSQCLEALLVVELADNVDEHLMRVNTWVAAAQDRAELAAE